MTTSPADMMDIYGSDKGKKKLAALMKGTNTDSEYEKIGNSFYRKIFE